jgi:HAD superfamily hydrolase (TIGR01509 family)
VIEAVIFDLDGVLIDSEPMYLEVARRVVAPGVLTEEDYARFIGTSGFSAWMHETYGIPLLEVRERYETILNGYVTEFAVPRLDGAIELIEAVQRRGVRTAIATQTRPDWVASSLLSSGLEPYIKTIVTSAEVERGKPAPDIYLHAARRLEVDPARCIAIEDSGHGVASAHAAGMIVVQSRQSAFPHPPQDGANVVIDSLRDFDLGWLDSPPH